MHIIYGDDLPTINLICFICDDQYEEDDVDDDDTETISETPSEGVLPELLRLVVTLQIRSCFNKNNNIILIENNFSSSLKFAAF